jgi:hypothetical protein
LGAVTDDTTPGIKLGDAGLGVSPIKSSTLMDFDVIGLAFADIKFCGSTSSRMREIQLSLFKQILILLSNIKPFEKEGS